MKYSRNRQKIEWKKTEKIPNYKQTVNYSV